jgi:hypothetical protein
MSGDSQDAEWSKIWNARQDALCGILGRTTGLVYHAHTPFNLGGFADVLPFPDFVPGMTYVTAELTGEEVGQQQSSLGNYELMICTRTEYKRAPDVISRLARYTRDAVLEAGQTMDIGTSFGDSTLRALLFAEPKGQPAHFDFLGARYGLLLCMAITTEELLFARSQGSDLLLAKLKEAGVFPYTVPDRSSIPLH